MMTNYARGHQAEQHAAEYLKKLGYSMLQINWKTRWCEIDIVAEKNGCIYFVEVKYRQSAAQGFGLDYVTPKKLKQMSFAAAVWVQAHDWSKEYCLAAIEVSGFEYEITDLVVL